MCLTLNQDMRGASPCGSTIYWGYGVKEALRILIPSDHERYVIPLPTCSVSSDSRTSLWYREGRGGRIHTELQYGIPSLAQW